MENKAQIIVSTNGFNIKVDCDMYSKLSKYKWWALVKKGKTTCVYRSTRVNGKQKTIRISQEILGIKKGCVIDHINRDPLDNRKSNLRHITQMQNVWNSSGHSGRSVPYKGVSKCEKRKKNPWKVQFQVNKKTIRVGVYPTLREAVIAYNEAITKHCGEFAFLNPVPPLDELLKGAK